MDRFARIFLSRLGLPLLALALGTLPWLAVRHSASARLSDRPAATSRPELGAPRVESIPGVFATPDEAKRIGVAGGRPSEVALTTFPEQPGEPAGPELTAPSPPSTPSVRPLEGMTGPLTLSDSPLSEPELHAAPPGPPPSAANDIAPPQETRPSAPDPLPPPSGTLLMPPGPTGVRSQQMENIARQADRQIRHGFELANRQAYFAARAEFVSALRLVAQALDTEEQRNVHSRALSAGLVAIKESQDFFPSGAKLEGELDMATIIAGHRTPVLKSAAAERVQPMAAMRCYLTFGQEQLAEAAGREVAGSMALYALGKLHATLARQRSTEITAAEPKAMVFFQAALLVYPKNYMASNDLGVLLAQCSNFADARRALQHSVSLYRGATGLANLATVCEQLGDAQAGAQLRQQAQLARQAEAARTRGVTAAATATVQWVDPSVFAQGGGVATDSPPLAKPAAPSNRSSAATAAEQSPGAKKGILSWLPWSQDKDATR